MIHRYLSFCGALLTACCLLWASGCLPPNPPAPTRDGATPPGSPPGTRTPSSHTTTMEEVGRANDNSFIEITDVLIRGDIAYACTGVQGFLIYDISNPNAMKVMARIGSQQGSRQYPRCQNVWVDGSLAVIANRGDEIQPKGFVSLFDIKDPNKPKELSAYTDGNDTSFEGLVLKDDVIYAAAHEKGLYILQKKQDQLTRISKLSGFQNAWGVALVGTTLVVADGPGGLHTIDVTDPKAPKRLATLPLAGFARRASIKDGMAYVSMGSDGFAIVDISTPKSPTLVGQAKTSHSILDLEIIGQTVVATNWSDIRVYDVSSPEKPVLFGAITLTPRSGGGSFTRNLAIGAKGDMAFVGEWEGLRSVRFRPGKVPIMSLDSHSVQFGALASGKPAAIAVRVDNEGQAPLEIKRFEVQGGSFRIQPSSLTIPPGKAEVFEVSLASAPSTPIIGSLTLHTNDPTKEVYRIPVKANEGVGGVGDGHLDFTFNDLDGNQYSLSKLRGKVVMLVYFATF